MIYLLRHCDKTQEAAAAPLSAKGYQQAEAIVPALAKLGIQRIISSPYKRALQSVAPFAESVGVALESDAALAEWRLSASPLSDWQATLSHGLAAQGMAASGGESADDVWARAQAVLSPPQPTLLVSHGGWLTIVLGRFGRPANLQSLLDIRSPDLFSISENDWGHHEL